MQRRRWPKALATITRVYLRSMGALLIVVVLSLPYVRTQNVAHLRLGTRTVALAFDSTAVAAVLGTNSVAGWQFVGYEQYENFAQLASARSYPDAVHRSSPFLPGFEFHSFHRGRRRIVLCQPVGLIVLGALCLIGPGLPRLLRRKRTQAAADEDHQLPLPSEATETSGTHRRVHFARRGVILAPSR